MKLVWSKEDEIYFASSLTWEGFRQQVLRCIFMSSLAWVAFDQHNLRYILRPHLHGETWSTDLEVHFVNLLPRGNVNTSWKTFCVVAGMRWVW